MGLYTPIKNVVLSENDSILLVFPVDVRKAMRVALAGFKVVRRYPLIYDYDELPELAPHGKEGYKTDFNYLGTQGLGKGDDVFQIYEEYPFRIYHFSIGVKPSFVGYYKASPAGYINLAWAWKTKPAVGDPRDVIMGSDSPYEEPTVIGETIIFHKLSFQIALANFGSIAVKPKLKVLGAAYDVVPMRDRTAIERVLRGEVRARIFSVGGLAEFPYTVPEEWKNLLFEFTERDLARVISYG